MPTPLQSAGVFGNSPQTVTFASTTAGSLLVAYVGSPTTARTCSASDSVNGAYSTDEAAASSASICTFPNNVGGGLTITGVASGGVTELCLIVEEWPGVLTVSPFDQKANNTGIGQTSGTTGTTPTLGSANELALALIMLNSNAGAGFAAQSPFNPSSVSPQGSGSNIFMAVGNYQPGSTAGVVATFDWTNSATYRACIATYKLAGATSPAPMPFSQTQFFQQDRVLT